jgi:uncharacterized protein YceK
MMRVILLILAVLLLCGCAPYRQINVGAAIPIYAANRAWMTQDYQRRTGETADLFGYYAASDPAIYVADDLSRDQFAAVVAHEMLHAIQNGEDPWAIADLTNSPSFPSMRDIP